MEQLISALSAGGQSASPAVLQLLSQLNAVAPLDVHICSPGGVGSTSLSNFLTRHGLQTNLLHDTDGLRHSPVPPSWSLPGQPDTPHPCKPRSVVYLYGNPYEVVVSHYRRGHAHHQACKTHRHPGTLGSAESFPHTAEEYFARGQDLFGLEAHFRSWQYGANAYDILLVRYESVFDVNVARELFTRICGHKCSPQQVETMAHEWAASHKPRLSQVPPSAIQGGMYAGLWADMASLPAIHLVPARRQGAASALAQQAATDELARLMAGA